MNTLRGKSGSHMIDLLFTLALFCVFAASSLMVVLIGANVYQSTVQSREQNFNNCTSVTYVSTKIRQYDEKGTVYLSQLDGVDALVLEQYINDKVYQTWIYYYNGALRELLTQADNIGLLTLDGGQPIVQLDGFTITQAGDSLLRLASIEDGKESVALLVGLRA